MERDQYFFDNLTNQLISKALPENVKKNINIDNFLIYK